MLLTLFRMTRRKIPSTTNFFPLTSINVRMTPPKTFWLLVLTLLSLWCKILSSYLASVPNYRNWTKTTTQKKRFFWSNLYKLEVMINSFIEMLELPNFVHMSTSTLWFESRDVINRNYDIFQNVFILRRPGVAIFAGIIKIITIFVKKIYKDSIKVKRIRNYVSKFNLYLYFLI